MLFILFWTNVTLVEVKIEPDVGPVIEFKLFNSSVLFSINFTLYKKFNNLSVAEEKCIKSSKLE